MSELIDGLIRRVAELESERDEARSQLATLEARVERAKARITDDAPMLNTVELKEPTHD